MLVVPFLCTPSGRRHDPRTVPRCDTASLRRSLSAILALVLPFLASTRSVSTFVLSSTVLLPLLLGIALECPVLCPLLIVLLCSSRGASAPEDKFETIIFTFSSRRLSLPSPNYCPEITTCRFIWTSGRSFPRPCDVLPRMRRHSPRRLLKKSVPLVGSGSHSSWSSPMTWRAGSGHRTAACQGEWPHRGHRGMHCGAGGRHGSLDELSL